jgi:phenylalanyl-tRNA synthetase beta chain
MKISLKWLQDFVDIEDFFLKPEELAQVLTFAGLEVESLESQAQKFDFVVTGLILKKDPHPEADRLTVCQVSTGQGVVHQIVCGAKNHNENDRVVVALPGAKLPNGLVIKESILRHVPSMGMLCSAEELGLPEVSEGILLLPKQAPLGMNFSQYYGLDDIILELKVTPNRADCLSHWGLAREIACLLKRPLKKSEFSLGNRSSLSKNISQESSGDSLQGDLLPGDLSRGEFLPGESLPGEGVSDSVAETVLSGAVLPGFSTLSPVTVQVQDSSLCSVYYGAYFTGVQVGPSPLWLKKRLESVGMKSINNVVDITNYIMVERGQPLHAFDGNQLEGSVLEVKRSLGGESFVSLDNQTYVLPEGLGCITGGSQVLALAGVVGGLGSGISDKTSCIFLEAACFQAQEVRQGSRRLGIQTDSSYRFSRGVDPFSLESHWRRAIDLVLELTGASLVGVTQYKGDSSSSFLESSSVTGIEIHPSFVSQKLGYSVGAEIFLQKMKSLGCEILESKTEGSYVIRPPSYRFDLETGVDLVEEFARLHGYDKIPETLPPLKVMPTQHQKEYGFQRALASKVVGYGFHEMVLPIWTQTEREEKFVGSVKKWDHFGFSKGSSISLLNPLSEDQSALRRLLSLGLWDRALYNIRQGLMQGQIFELGVVSSWKEVSSYQQSYHCAALSWGEPSIFWDQQNPCPLVLTLKDQMIKIFRSMGFKLEIHRVKDRSELPDFLHLGQAAWLTLDGLRVGFLGHFHPLLCQEAKVRLPVCVAELNLEPFFKKEGSFVTYQGFSRYPYVERDLALVVPCNLSAQSLEACFQKSLNQYLQKLELFDIYEDNKLPVGHRQLAYRLRFQKSEGTLSDVEVNQAMDQLLQDLKSDLGVQLREA